MADDIYEDARIEGMRRGGSWVDRRVANMLQRGQPGPRQGFGQGMGLISGSAREAQARGAPVQSALSYLRNPAEVAARNRQGQDQLMFGESAAQPGDVEPEDNDTLNTEMDAFWGQYADRPEGGYADDEEKEAAFKAGESALRARVKPGFVRRSKGPSAATPAISAQPAAPSNPAAPTASAPTPANPAQPSAPAFATGARADALMTQYKGAKTDDDRLAIMKAGNPTAFPQVTPATQKVLDYIGSRKAMSAAALKPASQLGSSFHPQDPRIRRTPEGWIDDTGNRFRRPIDQRPLGPARPVTAVDPMVTSPNTPGDLRRFSPEIRKQLQDFDRNHAPSRPMTNAVPMQPKRMPWRPPTQETKNRIWSSGRA